MFILSFSEFLKNLLNVHCGLFTRWQRTLFVHILITRGHHYLLLDCLFCMLLSMPLFQQLWHVPAASMMVHYEILTLSGVPCELSDNHWLYLLWDWSQVPHNGLPDIIHGRTPHNHLCSGLLASWHISVVMVLAAGILLLGLWMSSCY